MDTEQRFLVKVSEPTETGCLLWLACKNVAGYGYFVWGGRTGYAHRYAWERVHGPIPPDLEIDHIVCDNTSCVNVEHLKLSTERDNTLRSRTSAAAVNARKTHCLRGHSFSGDNLHMDPSGKRICIACKRAENSTDRARERKLAWYHKHHGKNRYKWPQSKLKRGDSQ
jgi:hypothetical protein